ncbi:MAG: hypothetical protein ACLQVI_19725 [Polyangiaceae bacterium]
MKPTRKAPLSDSIRNQLRALVERVGERVTLSRIRISRSALHRGLADLPVSEGTRAIIERDLPRADQRAAG